MEKKKVLIAVGLIIAVALGAGLAVYLPKLKAQSSYSVVYLATGEVYIGKLSVFPRLTLTDAYLLQIVKDKDDATKSNFQLTPLKDALWSPTKLYLNSKQVVFYGPVSESSKVAETLRGANK